MKLQKLKANRLEVGDIVQDIDDNRATIFKVKRIDKWKNTLVLEFIGGVRRYTNEEGDGYYFPLNSDRRVDDWYKLNKTNVCEKKCDPFFIKTDIHGYCKQCNKYLGYVRK